MRRDHPLEQSVRDMIMAARRAISWTAGKSIEDYRQDDMLRAAAERQLEIVGEAARRLPAVFREQHPEIPWRPIMAQRHILAHEYDDLQDDLLWKVVTLHLPPLMAQLEPLLDELDGKQQNDRDPN